MEVRFLEGDLTKIEVDAIVNPANSEGEMGGGVAAVIKKAGGKKIEKEAMEQAPIPIGQAALTSAGSLKCDYVIHAPTMEMPAQRTTVEKIQKAVVAALQVAKEYELEKVAIPGMGTGTGQVPIEEAAKAMTAVIQESKSLTGHIRELTLIDRNGELVQAWQKHWFDRFE